MKIARELERRLERLVDGITAALFGGSMHPVDLANRLVRQADLMVEEGVAGPVIPNRFEVKVNPEELDPEIDMTELGRELTNVLRATAIERGWRMDGPIIVGVTTDTSVAHGSIDCVTTIIAGDLAPWAQLTDLRGTPSFDVEDNREILGRGLDADIVIDGGEISRHHAIIFREGPHAWVRDLRSANGTLVNGALVGQDPVRLRPGDQVTFGPATFFFRLL